MSLVWVTRRLCQRLLQFWVNVEFRLWSFAGQMKLFCGVGMPLAGLDFVDPGHLNVLCRGNLINWTFNLLWNIGHCTWDNKGRTCNFHFIYLSWWDLDGIPRTDKSDRPNKALHTYIHKFNFNTNQDYMSFEETKSKPSSGLSFNLNFQVFSGITNANLPKLFC